MFTTYYEGFPKYLQFSGVEWNVHLKFSSSKVNKMKGKSKKMKISKWSRGSVVAPDFAG